MQDRPFGQGGASLQLLPGNRTISSSFCATTIAQNNARMNAKVMGNLIFLCYVLQSVLKGYSFFIFSWYLEVSRYFH